MESNDPRHGTLNGYCNLGCRCERCKVPWVAYNKQRRVERAKLIQPDDPRHGKQSFYYNHSCRCDKCKAAHAKRHRELAAAKRQEIVLA